VSNRQMRVAHSTQMIRALQRAAGLSDNGWTGLAAALSKQGGKPISKQAVHAWLYRGVPAERAVQIERVLDGAVLREELRPDLYEGMHRDGGR